VKNPNPDPGKHKEIPIWNAEDWLYEDFEVGKRARSIRRTISEGESMLFNAMVLDMHPYVADDVFAKEEGVFGKRLVAGAMVFSLGLGLMAHNNVRTFSYGYDKLRFIKPVFVGDTIYTVRTQLAALKKQVQQLEREVAQLRRKATQSQASQLSLDAQTVRFSAKGLRSLRKRLNLSAQELGQLVEVSGPTIYSWEGEKTAPRSEQKLVLAGLRTIGKREALARLQAIQGARHR